MWKNTDTQYGSIAKLLHWLIALIIISLLTVGLYMSDLAEADPSRATLYALHKSFGVTLFLLAFLRISWLFISPPPALPVQFEKKEKILVKAIQGMLYLLMFAMPISGYIMSVTHGYAVAFFGLFELPSLLEESHDLSEIFEALHYYMALALIAFLGLHIAGAIKHRLGADKEKDILSRML